MAASNLRRGDIIMLENAPKPEKNHEQKGYRPWLVVSDPFLKKFTPFAWVIPFTSEDKSFPTVVKWNPKQAGTCLLYTSPSPRDVEESRFPSCG